MIGVYFWLQSVLVCTCYFIDRRQMTRLGKGFQNSILRMRDIGYSLGSWPPRNTHETPFTICKGMQQLTLSTSKPMIDSCVQAIVAKEVVYNPAIVTIKASILFLYRRIFTERRFNKAFAITLWCTGTFVLAYSTAQAVLTVFHCTPVNALWNLDVARQCINFDDVLIVLSCLNIGTDIVILCLPMPQLWKLQIAKRRRLQLVAIFLLGGL